MFNAARRGPASIATLSRLSCTATRIHKPFLLQNPVSKYVQIQQSATVRAFTCNPRFNRHATAEAQLVEKEVEEEVSAQRLPTDEQIEEAVRYGPVTKFAELLERKMVSKSIVDTLTQRMGLETMTQVQSLTINESLKGIDV